MINFKLSIKDIYAFSAKQVKKYYRNIQLYILSPDSSVQVQLQVLKERECQIITWFQLRFFHQSDIKNDVTLLKIVFILLIHWVNQAVRTAVFIGWVSNIIRLICHGSVSLCSINRHSASSGVIRILTTVEFNILYNNELGAPLSV